MRTSRCQALAPVRRELDFVRHNIAQSKKDQKESYMAQREHSRTARIEARIAPEALAVVKRAAELQGRSVSAFVVAAAQEAAHRTIEETQIIRLSIEDQEAFAEAVLNPPPLVPAMERAIERYRRETTPSR